MYDTRSSLMFVAGVAATLTGAVARADLYSGTIGDFTGPSGDWAVVADDETRLFDPSAMVWRPSVAVTEAWQDRPAEDSSARLLASEIDIAPATWESLVWSRYPLVANELTNQLADDAPPEAHSFGESPSSLSLGLSGFATLGVIQLLRNHRKLRFGTVPEWLHDNCPSSLGPDVSPQPRLKPLPLPACCDAHWQQRAWERATWRFLRLVEPSPTPWRPAAAISPRGPPLFS